MAIAKLDRKVLESVLTKKKSVKFQFLAFQILISRCIRNVEEKPETLGERVKLCEEFIEKHLMFPDLVKDLEKLA